MIASEFEDMFGSEPYQPPGDLVSRPSQRHRTVDEVDLTRRLVLACELGELHVAMYLVDGCGASVDRPNARGVRPLFTAVQYGRVDVVGMLVQASADVDGLNADRRTPLFAAAEKGHTEIARTLLGARADVHIQNAIGVSPLLSACLKGRASPGVIEVADLLIAHGASVNLAEPREGVTPLRAACCRGRLPLVGVLIAAGVAIDALDALGETALVTVCRQGQVGAAGLLLNAGASLAPVQRAFTRQFSLLKNDELRWMLQARATEVAERLGAGLIAEEVS